MGNEIGGFEAEMGGEAGIEGFDVIIECCWKVFLG